MQRSLSWLELFASFLSTGKHQENRGVYTQRVQKGKINSRPRRRLSAPIQQRLRIKRQRPREKVDPAKDDGENLQKSNHHLCGIINVARGRTLVRWKTAVEKTEGPVDEMSR